MALLVTPTAGFLQQSRLSVGPTTFVLLASPWRQPAAVCSDANDGGQKASRQWLRPTGDPRLFWLDELIETPAERAERDQKKRENAAKWGAILSQADTFDESISDGKQTGPVTTSGEAKRGEMIVLLASLPIVAALAANVAGLW